MITIDTRAWLSTRFVLGGRDRATGLDCWGLYRAIVREVAGIDLGEHGQVRDYASIAREFTSAASGALWRQIDPADDRPTDLVLMTGLMRADGRLHQAPLHVGCVVEPGLEIDIEETTGVMVRPYRDTLRRPALPTIRPRVLGVYRHHALEGLV